MDKSETKHQTGDTGHLPSQSPNQAGPDEAASLDKHLVRGIAWTAAAKWSNQVFAWASLLVVARVLLPSDFGLVAMAAVYLGLAQKFSEFGFGSAVLTIRDLTGEHIKQINTFSAFSGAVGVLISCAAAIPLGWFFRAPRLPAVVAVMSSAFLMSGFQTVPSSLLQRALRFKLLSIMETVTAIAQALGTLVLALLGFGYWSLVAGNLIGTAVSTVLCIAWCPCGFARPQLRSIRHAVQFSWQVLVSRLAWNFYSDADFLVAGRVLGAAPLGAYTFAWNLATIPVEKVSALVGRVTPAFFSVVQTDYAALRRYLRTLTEVLALVTFPAALGLAVTAREFVSLALGKKWMGVIVPLELLAFYAAFRSIAALIPQVLTAVRETRFVMWTSLFAAVLLPCAFYIGSRWGTVGIAWGWIVAYPFVAVALYGRTFRRIGMPVREYLGAIRPALHGSLAMVVLVGCLKWFLSPVWPLYLRFGLEVLVGTGTYILIIVAFHRERVRAFTSMCRQLRA